MRSFYNTTLGNAVGFSSKLLSWGKTFPCLGFFDSNAGAGGKNARGDSSYDLIGGFGVASELGEDTADRFEALRKYHDLKRDWIIGYLSYDLKNQTETLSSGNFDGIGFPEMHFFQPLYLFLLKGNTLRIGYLEEFTNEKKVRELLAVICNPEIRTGPEAGEDGHPEFKIIPRISEKEYFANVSKIKQHISKGDIYEVNFCMEFYAEHVQVNPVETYWRLNELSHSPFSAFYRLKDRYLFSASPERFLKKTGDRLLSQPVKGTVRRGRDEQEDRILKEQLYLNAKERSENVMIVDIVRNDLARSALKGSVSVEELFGIYSFDQVHQMISSIGARLKPGLHFVDAIKNAFPMGSMTGAPKVKAMELIEQYESTRRGLYSGALGYISAEGDFDFNVVIRSILYNASSGYLSFMAGSAITSLSDAGQEYEECLLKARAMLETVNHAGTF